MTKRLTPPVKCEVKKCHRMAVYEIRRIKTGKWLKVCGTHDTFFGEENLTRQGCTAREARQINREVKHGL